MTETKLFSPGRQITFTRTFADEKGVHTEEGTFESTMTQEFADGINAACIADGEPPLFRHMDEVDLSGFTQRPDSLARTIGNKILRLLGR